ncbi:hypothetical protein [Aestuariibacter salexigens]|uniref:hypothetical protein n=1 Tax=Aestuariibacter salexigens TaxID=226010 RepID=UPI0004232429|nr:hypothetical protein [Aestuariibacter salexigens]
MKRLLTLLTSIAFSACLFAQDGEVIVVANVDNTSATLSKKQVRDLFMGGVNRDNLTPIALPPGDPTRVLFNTKVVGLTEARIQSYWAQMRFSGRSKPPNEIASVEALLVYLQHHQGSVGYVPAGTPLPDNLRVIYDSE